MHSKMSIRAETGRRASAPWEPWPCRCALLPLALANAEPSEPVSYGDGLELALARSGDLVTAPEWIQLFPKGPAINARDGRRWSLDDPQILVSAFTANQGDLAVDINHATEILGPKGEAAPAQGWIKEIAIRDGLVWARVEWNAAGALLVTSKAYRYVSPAFRHTKEGAIVAVTSVALVTQPALVLTALAQQQSQQAPKEDIMPLAARLAAALNLGASPSDDAIVQAVTTQVSLAAAARDPSQFVPFADLQSALARASTAEAALAGRETADKTAIATAAVEAAIEAGKVSPASKDHWMAFATAQPEAFAGAIAALTPTLTPPTRLKKPGDETGEAGLTTEQLSLCAALGVTPAAFAAEQQGTAQ